MSSSISNNRYTFEKLIDRLHQSASTFGYHRTDLPIIDNADVFLMKSGDQVVSKLFTFERHGSQLALRPEFTAAAAHRYAQLHTDSAPVVRWQFDGAVFKEDTVGADYQHYSVGAELIGLHSSFADAEIIGVALAAMRALGIDDYHVILGHTGLLRDLLSTFHLDGRSQRFILNRLPYLKQNGVDAVLNELGDFLGHGSAISDDTPVTNEATGEDTQRMLDTLLDAAGRGDTMGSRTRFDITQRLLSKQQRAADKANVANALKLLVESIKVSGNPSQVFERLSQLIPDANTAAQNALDNWQRMVTLLTDVYELPSEQITFQPDLSRDWNYYTGMVFEIRHGGLLLCGGGRYDELIRLMGGRGNVPAVGLAYFPEGFLNHLDLNDNRDKHLTVTLEISADTETHTARWATALRKAGQMVEVMPTGGAEKVVIVQPDGTAMLEGMAYTLDQVDMLVSEWKSR